MRNDKILLIEICNFSDYPIGGYLSFAKQLLTVYGNQLALVGLVTDDETPTGIWIKKKIDGTVYDFFAVKRVSKDSRKKIIPERLKNYYYVRKYRKEILSLNISNLFIQTPEVLFAINASVKLNLCCVIPGLENPLLISRYSYSKYFSKIFDIIYFNFLKKARIIFATGDNDALKDYLVRSKGVLNSNKIIKFPSRVNTNIFKLFNKEDSKKKIGWSLSKSYVVTSGRLSQLKGWKFMLDCFIEFKKANPNSHFVFIGDGEDKEKIKGYIIRKKLISNVTITGQIDHNQLSTYLNAADLYIMGSYVEGWSTSLVEAMACANPVVCTDFSSASELIDQGFNGFVIKNRNQDEYVNAMLNSLDLPLNNLIIKSKEMKKYSTDLLKSDISKHWKLDKGL